MTFEYILNLIFKEYWSAIVLILGVLAYFIKRRYDLKSKKLEVNHSLFQQNRIEAVHGFLEKYAEIDTMWPQLNYHRLSNRGYGIEELDTLVTNKLFELDKSIYRVSMYFNKEEIKKFTFILHKSQEVWEKLGDTFLDTVSLGSRLTSSQKIDDFTVFRKTREEEIMNKIYEIGDLMKSNLK